MREVAIVTIQYPPTIGGLQAHVKGIVELVESLGYNTHVITSEPNPTMRAEGTVDPNVIQLPAITWFKDTPILSPITLYRTLKRLNPDIVHVVYPFPLSLDVACFYAITNRKKLIATYIDDIIVEFSYSIIINIYERILWKMWTKFIRAISVSSKEYGLSCNGLKGWNKDFCIIPPPVFDTDFKLTLKDKKSAKERLGLDKYDKVVLFVGGLRKRLYYKRPDLLLKAWAKFIQESEGNYVLDIVGDGELRRYYEKMAKDLGLTRNNTVFMGYVPRKTLIDCYLAGDVFVLPSQDNNEAFGVTAVEAMLYGNVLIVSDIPGLRGAVRKENNVGVSLIPVGDWLKIVEKLKFWLSKDLRDYAIRNHKYVKKHFNKEKIREEVRRLYNSTK